MKVTKAFGAPQVVDGADVVQQLEALGSSSGKLSATITIADCGIADERRPINGATDSEDEDIAEEDMMRQFNDQMAAQGQDANDGDVKIHNMKI